MSSLPDASSAFPDVNAVFGAALSLPAATRATLAEKLLESLEGETTQEIESAWAEEAERRMDVYRQGRMAAEDGERFFASRLSRPTP